MGGYLRDSLLSSPSRDLDIAVPGDPQPLARELAGTLGGVFVPLSPAHGVARVVVPGPHPRPLPRQEGDGPPETGLRDGWVMDLAGFWGTIQEDLARRDFTINAMALPWEHWRSGGWQGRVLDPFGGREDLARKCIRAVSAHIIEDDAGRLLRAVRLAARLQFRLAPETARLIRRQAPRIAGVSPERVREEFLAILSGDGARGQLEVLDRLDLLCRIVPELAATKGVTQPQEHHWDVWGHLLHTVEAAERMAKGHGNSPVYSHVPWTAEVAAHFSQEASDGHSRLTLLKLAALLHDIAKPQTRQTDATGRTRFPGHSELGATAAATLLAGLRLSSRGIDLVTRMVEHHLRPTQLRQGDQLPSARAIYRYYRDLGEAAIDTLFLSLADYLAAKGPDLVLEEWADHAKMVGYVLHVGAQQSAPAKRERLLTGHDVMQQFNLGPGPRVGLLLQQVDEARAAGEIATREEALALLAATFRAPAGGQ